MKRIRRCMFVDYRRSALAFVAVVSVMMLSGVAVRAASPGDSTGAAVEVKIDNFVFNPGVVTVKVGTQVTWINKDDIPHTVDSTQGKFKSGALDTDDKFQFRFTEPGEYPFFCRLHPKMTGKIVVQP